MKNPSQIVAARVSCVNLNARSVTGNKCRPCLWPCIRCRAHPSWACWAVRHSQKSANLNSFGTNARCRFLLAFGETCQILLRQEKSAKSATMLTQLGFLSPTVYGKQSCRRGFGIRWYVSLALRDSETNAVSSGIEKLNYFQ